MRVIEAVSLLSSQRWRKFEDGVEGMVSHEQERRFNNMFCPGVTSSDLKESETDVSCQIQLDANNSVSTGHSVHLLASNSARLQRSRIEPID